MKVHQVSKINAIIEEVEASFNFIMTGLLALKEQTSTLSNNHVALQLLSSGFERVLKILLLIKYKHLEGEFPELQKAKEHFRSYDNGHGIEKMLDELIDYSTTVDLMQRVPMVVEDMKFVKNDPKFRQFIGIITQFSIQQRYYYIDTIILENEIQRQNPFYLFKSFIYSFEEGVDVTQQSYEEEDIIRIKNSITCIEKGVRAISRFFTHGFDGTGVQYYNNFSNFILLKDEDLGFVNYSMKSELSLDSYQPLSANSSLARDILEKSKSKIIYSSEQVDWAFKVDFVEVFSLNEKYFFTKIGNEIFALNGKTLAEFKIAMYDKSSELKPRQFALYLHQTAQKL